MWESDEYSCVSGVTPTPALSQAKPLGKLLNAYPKGSVPVSAP